MEYWKEEIPSLRVEAWLCRDERGAEVGKIRDQSDPRRVIGYDPAAVEVVLARRWGLSLAALESRHQARNQAASESHQRFVDLVAQLKTGVVSDTVASEHSTERIARLEAQVSVLQQLALHLLDRRVHPGGPANAFLS